MPDLHAEHGFGLVELLIAMVVLQIALLAMIGVFGAGAVALGRASNVNTAATLADQQMELYRAMPYDAIGLDTAGAPTTGSYVSDTVACPSGSPVCLNTGPRNNVTTSTSPWQCTNSAAGSYVPTYFSSGTGVNPCTAHRLASGSNSPDGRSYYVDTYVRWFQPSTAQRSVKQVTVIVRDATSAKVYAKEITTFDCSTGNPPAAAPCT
jgi:Tfp pilus assembly protein PilV